MPWMIHAFELLEEATEEEDEEDDEGEELIAITGEKMIVAKWTVALDLSRLYPFPNVLLDSFYLILFSINNPFLKIRH